MIPILVLTSPKNAWAIEPFAYLFRLYWSTRRPVIVAGADDLPAKRGSPKPLPDNFELLAGYEREPASEWSQMMIDVLRDLGSSHAILMLEDFWLYTHVKALVVSAMERLALHGPDRDRILRIDLTGDRASMKERRLYGYESGVQVIRTPAGTPYQMSYQAGIWQTEHLLDVLRPGENPWRSELNGTDRLALRDDLLVLGTLVHPVRYAHVLRRNKARAQNLDLIPEPHESAVRSMTPRGVLK